jgi:hypothetical protein
MKKEQLDHLQSLDADPFGLYDTALADVEAVANGLILQAQVGAACANELDTIESSVSDLADIEDSDTAAFVQKTIISSVNAANNAIPSRVALFYDYIDVVGDAYPHSSFDFYPWRDALLSSDKHSSAIGKICNAVPQEHRHEVLRQYFNAIHGKPSPNSNADYRLSQVIQNISHEHLEVVARFSEQSHLTPSKLNATKLIEGFARLLPGLREPSGYGHTPEQNKKHDLSFIEFILENCATASAHQLNTSIVVAVSHAKDASRSYFSKIMDQIQSQFTSMLELPWETLAQKHPHTVNLLTAIGDFASAKDFGDVGPAFTHKALSMRLNTEILPRHTPPPKLL